MKNVQARLGKTFGFELFEIIVLTVVGLGAMYGVANWYSEVKGWSKNGKKTRVKWKKNFFEKLKVRFESGKKGRKVTLIDATENPTPDEQNRLTEYMRNEMKMIPKFTYEKDS